MGLSSRFQHVGVTLDHRMLDSARGVEKNELRSSSTGSSYDGGDVDGRRRLSIGEGGGVVSARARKTSRHTARASDIRLIFDQRRVLICRLNFGIMSEGRATSTLGF